jgi:hypothetical protein
MERKLIEKFSKKQLTWWHKNKLNDQIIHDVGDY